MTVIATRLLGLLLVAPNGHLKGSHAIKTLRITGHAYTKAAQELEKLGFAQQQPGKLIRQKRRPGS